MIIWKVIHMAERQSAQLVIRVQPTLRKELDYVPEQLDDLPRAQEMRPNQGLGSLRL